MNVAIRRIVCSLVAALILVQGFVPTLAMADLNMRCAGQPQSAPPCAHETISGMQAGGVDAMTSMPCCRGMRRLAISESGLGLSTPAVSGRRCIVTVVWTNTARPVPALSHARPASAATTATLLPSVAAKWVEAQPALYCAQFDTGPPGWISNAILHSRSLRAPPLA